MTFPLTLCVSVFISVHLHDFETPVLLSRPLSWSVLLPTTARLRPGESSHLQTLELFVSSPHPLTAVFYREGVCCSKHLTPLHPPPYFWLEPIRPWFVPYVFCTDCDSMRSPLRLVAATKAAIQNCFVGTAKNCYSPYNKGRWSESLTRFTATCTCDAL